MTAPYPGQIPAWIDGTLTPVDKLDAHKRGLRHKAVSVFVTRGDTVLIQRRAMVKYHTPGLWANTCCTHPDWDEPSLSCAHRRLDEELGITGLAGKAIIVFVIIGATFGPILGAMLVEYLFSGGKWSGPRAGFNPAGWISWVLGAVVGVLPILKIYPVPAAPVAAFIVGAVVYALLAKMGMQSRLVEGCATESGEG